MSMHNKVTNDLVVSMDYTLKIDGEIIDSSLEQEPLDFIQGAGNIIPGLERELDGMAVGESKEVFVRPEDGYGVLDSQAYIDVPNEQFPEEIPLEIGIEIQVEDDDGNAMYARIESIEDDFVRLNFNHPLAGKELHFEVTIIALREATEEELDHGHVHYGHDH